MDKFNINESIKENGYIQGGSKEAAIKVREVLKNIAMANENILLLGRSGVDAEDFLQSVRKLVTYAAMHEDTKVDTWYCETDCIRAPNPKCPYRPFTFKQGIKICPHYIEEDK